MAAQAYIKQFAYKSLTSWEFRDFFVQARRASASLRSVYSGVLGSALRIVAPRMYAYLHPASSALVGTVVLPRVPLPCLLVPSSR